jgi:hypothetical protein
MPRIDDDAFETATQSAHLKSNSKEEKPELQRHSSVYDVPKAWIAIIKNNKSGLRSFSSYASVAIYEKLVRDGLIKED